MSKRETKIEVPYIVCESLEKDLQRAKVYLDRYETKKISNRKSSVAYLCANMGITSISESTIDALMIPHAGFNIGGQKLEGIWVSKYEPTGTVATEEEAANFTGP